MFWTTLDKLTYFALKEVNDNNSFVNFDKCTRTKLRLAHLQYPSLEIYSLSISANNSSIRILLIALVWLIAKYDVLSNIIKLKLINSSLGREFSKVDTLCYTDVDDVRLSSIQNLINNLLHKTNKLSCNLKAISELYLTKIKLMTKVHTASIATCGLPHLTVSEMSLIKKIAAIQDNKEIEAEKLKELEEMASMLDIHMKWTKKSHVFYTWMNTVLDEYEEADTPTFGPEAITELSKFIYLLMHIVRRRLFRELSKSDSNIPHSNSVHCPSRLLRVQKSNNNEMNAFLNEIISQYNTIDDNLKKQRTNIEIKLKSILSFIPNCVHV
ncbi:PREDICTED: uncharacterized protein LOC105362932 isoform X2 [Ceratosolen solmsi marchali]|nr:PREDICTED: uncharacterized protein LOC105362932 isoform X2 [Ceratosolen solmsi marchali]